MTPETGTRDLLVNRWAPFVHLFAFQGLDLTGATFAGAIRQVKDGTGAPLKTLGSAGSGSAEGFFLQSVATETVDFGTVNGVDVGEQSVPVSYVQMRVNEASIEALPRRTDGNDVELYWDMQVTPSGGDKYRALEGAFTVHAGVTGSS